MQYPDVGTGHNYQKLSNYYGDMYRPQVPPSFSENWPVNVQGEKKNKLNVPRCHNQCFFTEDPRLLASNANGIAANNDGFLPDRKWHQQVPGKKIGMK